MIRNCLYESYKTIAIYLTLISFISYQIVIILPQHVIVDFVPVTTITMHIAVVVPHRMWLSSHVVAYLGSLMFGVEKSLF